MNLYISHYGLNMTRCILDIYVSTKKHVLTETSAHNVSAGKGDLEQFLDRFHAYIVYNG